MDSRVTIILLAALILVPCDVTKSQELNGSKAVSSQELLPASTKAWVSIPDSSSLDEKFLATQMGQLSQDKKLAPFIDGLKAQFKNWLNEKNVRLGLNINDIQNVRSGEICIAGILPPQVPGNKEKLGRHSHGMVLLVDVSENLEEAKKLMDQVATELKGRGVTKEKYEPVFGTEVSKWKFPKKKRLEVQRFAYQTIANGWLLSSDNEAVFRRVVRRLVNIDNAQANDTLASQIAFQNVMKNVALKDIDPQIYWFVNPFGYLELAQAIAREKETFQQANNDDWVRILKKIGFDGFKGVGGYIAMATEEHDILHRTFVYKPANAQDVKQKQVFDLFHFENLKGTRLDPPKFVADTVSSYFCGTWNMQLALKNIGHAVDTFAKKPGTLDETLETLKEEMQVDVRQTVSQFDNELMIISETKLPIEKGSERLTIGISSKAVPAEMTAVIQRSWPNQHKVTKHGKHRIIEIDESIGEDDLDLDDDEGGIFGEDEDEPEEEEEPQFNLFETRVCSATEDFLFVANSEENLKKILDGPTAKPLVDSRDYKLVSAALDAITDGSKISFRQFSRLDRILRPNYEMMRAGKMGASDTILARVLNQVIEPPKGDENAVRMQKIDGALLPADFEKDVAPYFGPSGWIMETTYEGWLFSGVVLKGAEVANQVVQKDDATSPQHK